MIRTYTELSKLNTLEERFRYLMLKGHVGIETFGFDRYLNQVFYTSPEWQSVRRKVIVRDNGFEMGLQDYPIAGRILVHHINPILIDDITERNPDILNPEYLVCVSHEMHNAIHYGDDTILKTKTLVERYPGDTKLW